MENRAELISDLKGWCRGELLDEVHAVMVVLQEEVGTSEIEETMQIVKSLGRVRVRSRNFNLRRNEYYVLCECRGEVKGDTVPPEVFPIGGGGPWFIVIVDKDNPTSTEGPEPRRGESHVEDVHPLLSAEGAATKSTEAILRAVSDLLDKTSRSSNEYGSYRRLRTFSGLTPTPAGEKQFEHWLGQARLLVEECDCLSKEKRRRLMESV